VDLIKTVSFVCGWNSPMAGFDVNRFKPSGFVARELVTHKLKGIIRTTALKLKVSCFKWFVAALCSFFRNSYMCRCAGVSLRISFYWAPLTFTRAIPWKETAFLTVS